MGILLLVSVFLLSFVMLYLFTEYFFIPSLDGISQRWRLSSDISGSTLMAIGSSAPELAVMVVAVLKHGHHEAVGVGTIVGSALFNLFVITGVVLLMRRRSHLTWQPLVRDLLFYALTVLLLAWAFTDSRIQMAEAMTFLAVYLLYLVSLRLWKRWFPYEDREPPVHVEEAAWVKKLNSYLRRWHLLERVYLLFFVSTALISVMAWLLVTSAIALADALQVPEFLVAVVVIAVGTSIPDLVASALVARRGRAGMAINNAIGSNIFDILIGIGLPLSFHHLFSDGIIHIQYTDLRYSILFLTGSIVLLLFLFLGWRWRIPRRAGGFLILLYLVFLMLEIQGTVRF